MGVVLLVSAWLWLTRDIAGVGNEGIQGTRSRF